MCMHTFSYRHRHRQRLYIYVDKIAQLAFAYINVNGKNFIDGSIS